MTEMEYWVVTEETIDDIAKRVAGNFLDYQKNLKSYYERELARHINYNQHLVVFKLNDQWHQVAISKQYNVDFVMTNYDFSN